MHLLSDEEVEAYNEANAWKQAEEAKHNPAVRKVLNREFTNQVCKKHGKNKRY